MFIYGLFSPDDELRYIGLTIRSLDVRLHDHLDSYRLKKDNYKNNWIKSLLKAGQKPYIQLIQELTNLKDLKEAEKYWIYYFKSQGCRLVNVIKAGGFSGPEKGRKYSEQGLNNIVQSNKNRIFTPEILEKMSNATKRQFSNIENRIASSRMQGGRAFCDQFGQRYETVNDAARKLQIHRSQIQRVLKKQNMRQTHGFIFTYIEE